MPLPRGPGDKTPHGFRAAPSFDQPATGRQHYNARQADACHPIRRPSDRLVMSFQVGRSPDVTGSTGQTATVALRIGSTLDPGQAARLPAIDTASVPVRTERPLETTCHIVGQRVPASPRRDRRRPAARARPANEIQRGLAIYAEAGKGFVKIIEKRRIDGHVRKALPLDEQHPPSDRAEIRKADEVPLRHGPDIDQHRRHVVGQRRPRLMHVEIGRIAFIFAESPESQNCPTTPKLTSPQKTKITHAPDAHKRPTAFPGLSWLLCLGY